jgi:hypothetical protein
MPAIDYPPTPDASNDYVGAIASPNLSNAVKPKNRSIIDEDQAKSIITTLEVANKERNLKNARIMAKYNSERPHTQASLEAEGLGWKSNFTSKPLPMLIDKVAPRFVEAIEGVKYLTNSALPDDEPGAAVKTEAFRREITSTCRARPGWRSLLSELGQENALFGYAALAQLDEFHWFPKFFRQDKFFIPTGTKQLPNFAQIVALREEVLIHELAMIISDKETAKDRGWDIPKTVKSINAAMPENRRSDQKDPERAYEDMIRESVVGTSYEAGARAVCLWHLFATEITGKISHYVFDAHGFEELFVSEDQYESMADAVSFFSFQQGNGTMHGSKGIGREIYAMAGILDKARNDVVDRLNLSGKIIIQGDEKQLARFKMSIVGNAILIGAGFTVAEKKLDAEVEPFLQLDAFLTSLLDQMAGATTPKVFEGERVTKAQVDLFAAREEQSRDTIIGRFLNQFADMMTTLQKRLCDADTAEKDAKEMQKRLLKVMTREELNKLSKQPVAETVKDYTDLERQQIVIAATEAAGNPLYNQKELQMRKVSAQVNEEFAKAVILPDEDPTVLAEQTRLQQLELLIIVGQGAEVPVSPRDNHLVHLQVLTPAMDNAAQAATADPHAVATLTALLKHAEAHVAAAEAAGTPKETLAPVTETITKLRAAMAELTQLAEQQVQVDQQAAQAGQAAAAIDAGQIPPTPTA